MTIKYNNVYINDTYTIGGTYEKDGPISKYIDKLYLDDLYFGEETVEAAETKILRESIENIIKKNDSKKIDYLVAGDLQNQISSSSYAIRNLKIPFIGIYNACATFGEGLLIASNFIKGKLANNIIVSTSSHNMVSEKQFRNPNEYGAPKKKTQTFTSTGAVSVLLSSEKSKIKIVNITPGTINDVGYKNVNDMGGVMAISAANTLLEHFKDTKLDPSYYDLILTGDLGKYGKEILLDYLKQNNLDISKNYNDCGLILYDIDNQPVFAGASGPSSSALVFSSYIYKEMQKGKINRVLLVPTGALFSPTRVFQGESIPSIAHAISIEVDLK